MDVHGGVKSTGPTVSLGSTGPAAYQAAPLEAGADLSSAKSDSVEVIRKSCLTQKPTMSVVVILERGSAQCLLLPVGEISR